MSDFASAMMVRVLAQGMRDLGLLVPQGLEPRDGTAAHVGLDLKRVVVASAMQQGGIGVLPRLARGLARFRNEPMHHALANARSVADLFARWQRLERYIHSRHRVVVESIDEGEEGGRALLRHVAQQGPAPLAAEDLVVLGVLVALLEEVGASDVRAWLSGVAVLPESDAEADTEALEAAARDGLTARWTLDWHVRAERPQQPRRRAAVGAAMPTAESLASAGWPDIVMQTARLLACDLASPPSVAALAQRMDRSARSLQRALEDAGSSYSTLLAVMRSRAASWWLVHTDHPVAEVGFVCGYSDQPHFTREFRRRVGAAPAAFREAFTATG